MAQPNNPILLKMLDRLFAAMVNGPSLNCRPHASRQRVDLAQLARLADAAPEDVLRSLLHDPHRASVRARVLPPPAGGEGGGARTGRYGNKRAEKRSPAKAARAADPVATNDSAPRAAIPTTPAADVGEFEGINADSGLDGLDELIDGDDPEREATDGADAQAHLGPGAPKGANGRLKATALPDGGTDENDDADSPDGKRADRAWSEQQAVLARLATIAQDAKTYEQDTGVHVLNVGFPLLSLPPGTFGGRDGPATRRVLAPIAFVPVSLVIKRGAAPSIELATKASGVDLVMPNAALLAWLDQQTGKPAEETLHDEDGIDPWREISDLVRQVATRLGCALPDVFAHAPARATKTAPIESNAPAHEDDDEQDEPIPPTQREPAGPPGASAARQIDPLPVPGDLKLSPAPRADESDAKPAILVSAVLGLFPMANQGLLRDMQAMAKGEDLAGPVQSFIELGVSLDRTPEPLPDVPADQPAQPRATINATDERFVSAADPCQARAVRLARSSSGLVVHGPPGTGKSQTITNIVGDHLARGQRVLLVCDKRTALDVVSNRLHHMGLGDLCALVHDPQRDQRELYRRLRQQLEDLADSKSDPKSVAKLAKVDGELQSLHAELTGYRDALARPGDGHGLSFHDLAGQWLALCDADAFPAPTTAAAVPLALLDERTRDLTELFTRGRSSDFPRNPWSAAAGGPLNDFLARPMDAVRQDVAACAAAAGPADATVDPSIPAFAPAPDLASQAEARTALAEKVERLTLDADPLVLARWAREKSQAQRDARQKLTGAEPFLKILDAGPLDAELALSVSDRLPTLLEVGQHLAALAAYIDAAKKWYAFLLFKPKSAATPVLNRYGLTLSPANAERLHAFLTGLRARLVVDDVVESLGVNPETPTPVRIAAPPAPTPGKIAPTFPSDAALVRSVADHTATLDLLLSLPEDPRVAALLPAVRAALLKPASAPALVDGLRKSAPRAAAVTALESAAQRTKLFAANWLSRVGSSLRNNGLASPTFAALAERVETLEAVLRVREGLASLAEPLKAPVAALIASSPTPDEALRVLRREALAAEIGRRLARDPHLQGIDGQRMTGSFEQYRTLESRKRDLVRDAIRHRWLERQRERLLAATGTRLSPMGAALKRRLTTRGERAMRLRQVVENGRKTEGGDPLFDLCPVWMCSPETVAQVFPRRPIFDVVVFDEASQCRLEEALPVLLRGGRVVIAGDPKQLPPTRFFESALAASDDDEIETDQQLFETQQGEVEDLLEAALGLDIRHCYLDVHYRSRNADLIAFSNEHFYHARLQPLPAHPSARADAPPVVLHRAGGTYERRHNEAEADRVVEIVRDLLRRKDAPSIGVACFNLPQRDLIVEKLDDLAAEDPAFAKRLAAAQQREGEGSFEGLFVKNLENVQGDERDHIIISTTYGPDAQGRFHRRFGPLGRSGGGRRLNVLVTRAREAVHLVTSIPAEAYRTLPPPEAGQSPGGAWLLFAYLKFAEAVGERYRETGDGGEVASSGATAEGKSAKPRAADLRSGISEGVKGGNDAVMGVTVHPTRSPSGFAEALARRLHASHGIPADVHWGNDGFCVDVALRDPANPADVRLGVLCDAARFAAADDPMEWDLFRTAVLESQGWRLHRLWTPHFFRDPKGVTRAVMAELE